jgi:hypothetical protein
MGNALSGLFRSRKFMVALWGLAQTVILHYLSVDMELIVAVDGVVMIVIAGIAAEDSADKLAGTHLSQKKPR